MRSFRLFAAAGLLAGLAACDSTSPSSPELAADLAVAAMSGEAAAQHVEMMRGPGGPLGFGFQAEAGKFECTNGGRDGVTVTRTCTFKDAQGNVQPAYDATTTASVVLHAEVNGTLDRGHMGGTMQRVSDLTVTGLAGAETSMTWNGTSSGSSSRVHTRDGGTMEMAMSEQESIAGVVIPVPRTPTSWPTAGTISRQVTVTFTGGPKDGTTETRNVTITFDGTQYATITVNGETFQFDLAKRGKPEHGKGGPEGHGGPRP
jgi:hypothetical protein